MTLGGYDGADAWTLRSWSASSQHGRIVASLHERLHHELQNTTLWGLLTRSFDDLRVAGQRPATSSSLFWTGVMRAQYVHETYATTLATGMDAASVALLDENPFYRAHRERGLALVDATADSWEVDRFLIDATLRACMMAPGLVAVVRSFPAVALRDFDAPTLRPDERLRILETIDLRAARDLVDGSPHDIPALRRLHDGVAAFLEAHGLPVLGTAGYAQCVEVIVERLRAAVPGIVIEIDDDRTDAVADMLEESQREVIELHEHPLEVEVQPLEDIAGRDFLRDHERLGLHLLSVWVKADLLARQFRGPDADALRARGGHVLALQAADRVDGRAFARLAIIAEPEHLRALAAGLPGVRVLQVTTQASILDAPEDTAIDADADVYVLVDQPVLEQFRHTFAQDSAVRFARVEFGGDRDLSLFVLAVAALPGIRYLHLAHAVAADALSRWLEAQGPERAQRDSALWDDDAAAIEAVAGHLVGTWWRLDQTHGRRS